VPRTGYGPPGLRVSAARSPTTSCRRVCSRISGRHLLRRWLAFPPRTAIPIHYEGWKHFRQGREAIEAEFATAPQAFRDSVRWLPIGEPVELGA
jgi:hypothetical protein